MPRTPLSMDGGSIKLSGFRKSLFLSLQKQSHLESYSYTTMSDAIFQGLFLSSKRSDQPLTNQAMRRQRSSTTTLARVVSEFQCQSLDACPLDRKNGNLGSSVKKRYTILYSCEAHYAYHALPPPQAKPLLKAAYDRGLNTWDTGM